MLNVVVPAGAVRRSRWMIVDDDRDVLMVLQRIAARISDADIECFRASQDALAAFEAAPGAFDFVMTDLDMPGMNGLELCDFLRAMSPRLKIFLVTANQTLSREELAQRGFCGFVHKPFHVAGLVNALVAAGVSNLPSSASQPIP